MNCRHVVAREKMSCYLEQAWCVQVLCRLLCPSVRIGTTGSCIVECIKLKLDTTTRSRDRTSVGGSVLAFFIYFLTVLDE